MKKQIDFQKKSHRLLVIALGIGSVLISLQCYAQDEKENPKSTAIWEPVPVVITPGQGTAPPSDAIILLDDAARPDEKEILDLWLLEYPNFDYEYIDLDRGAVILRRK